MKKFILFLLCLALTIGTTLATDIHLKVTGLRSAHPSGTPPEPPLLYVLLLPNKNGEIDPVVFDSFNSEDMRAYIRVLVRHGFIPAASTLHFDPSPILKRPTDAQIQSLKDFCKDLGLTLVISQTT